MKNYFAGTKLVDIKPAAEEAPAPAPELTVTAPDNIRSFKLRRFHGIDQSQDENDIPLEPDCYTHKGLNYWIERGNLMCRNNFGTVLAQPIKVSSSDTYSYVVKSLHMYPSTSYSATRLIVGVDVYNGVSLDHRAMMWFLLDGGTYWTEYTMYNGSTWVPVRFVNTEFSFVNYEYGGTMVVIAVNGADPDMMIYSGYLQFLKCSGFAVTTVDPATDTFFCTAGYANDTELDFYSPYSSYPDPIYSFFSEYRSDTYYVVNASGNNFQISDVQGGSAINITTAGSSLLSRDKLANYLNDAPIGKNVILYAERLWIGVITGDLDKIAYSDKYHDGTAHPTDWSTPLITGFTKQPTWDGDHLVSLRSIDGRAYAHKENSVFAIEGTDVPFTFTQLFTASGTIAPKSITRYAPHGLTFYATLTGIQVFNGQSSESYLGPEIADMWYPDPNLMCNVVGDTLYVYGQMYDPLTGALGPHILAVDLLTKNICPWDMMQSGLLQASCTLDPWFTTIKSDVTFPEFWFAWNGMIYKYNNTKPASAAQQMTYYPPETDLGDSSVQKVVQQLSVTGKGGSARFIPIVDGVAGTAIDVELPAANGVVTPVVIGVTGYLFGLKIENVGGDPIEIHDIQVKYTMLGG